MRLKEFDILLDIKRSKKAEEFEVVQNDYDTNILNISIVDGLEVYPISGLHIEIAFAKPDGTTVLQDLNNGVEIIGDKVVCTLKTNTIAAPGKVQAEVRFLEGTKLLTSAKFTFFVRKSIVNDDTIESTNEFPILNQLINTTQDLIDQVGQIEQQVPENIVTQLNEVSDLANQLQTDLDAHKAENVNNADTPHGIIYEKGTWTPILVGSDIAGSHTYAQQAGRYIRNGNTVLLTIRIAIASTGLDSNMVGDLRIAGLPFTPVGRCGGSLGRIQNIVFSTNQNLSLFTLGGNAYVGFAHITSGGSVANVTNTSLSTSTTIIESSITIDI